MIYRMTSTLRHNESDVICAVNQTAAGSYVVISNEQTKEKLFEYHKKNFDTALLQWITDNKLLTCIRLN